MRVLLVLWLLVCAGQARAQSGPDQGSIQAVISHQIEAFRRDDGAAAFSFAAPNIREMFQTEANFMGMVARGYQPVYRPRDVQFGELANVDGVPTQTVELIGPDGLAYTALYSMEKEPDGSWKIAGCQILRRERVGV
jgi:ketosteroid isomerase-like protein